MKIDGDQIEPELATQPWVLVDPALGRPAYPAALGSPQSLGRGLRALATGLDLDERDHPVPKGDHIEFVPSGAPVPGQNPIAAFLQPPAGKFLAGPAGGARRGVQRDRASAPERAILRSSAPATRPTSAISPSN